MAASPGHWLTVYAPAEIAYLKEEKEIRIANALFCFKNNPNLQYLFFNGDGHNTAVVTDSYL